MANKRRVYQIAERLRMVLATELTHAADPRFFLVTITSVVVSPDLRQAKVYWVVSGDREQRIPEVEEAFESAGGRFKRVAGKELGIRFAPDLKFFYDDTLDTSEEVARLMARIASSSEGKPPSEGGE